MDIIAFRNNFITVGGDCARDEKQNKGLAPFPPRSAVPFVGNLRRRLRVSRAPDNRRLGNFRALLLRKFPRSNHPPKPEKSSTPRPVRMISPPLLVICNVRQCVRKSMACSVRNNEPATRKTSYLIYECAPCNNKTPQR